MDRVRRGTTTYFGKMGDGVEKPLPKENAHCAHDTCAATLRLSAANGAVDWVRTAQGLPRWNFWPPASTGATATSTPWRCPTTPASRAVRQARHYDRVDRESKTPC